jgi:hypothetical protein
MITFRIHSHCNLPRRLYTLFFPIHRTMPPFVAENPEPGSGGLTVTDEMRRLIAKPGFLTCGSRGEGDGSRLRALYQDRASAVSCIAARHLSRRTTGRDPRLEPPETFRVWLLVPRRLPAGDRQGMCTPGVAHPGADHDLSHFPQLIESGRAPDIEGTETPYKCLFRCFYCTRSLSHTGGRT